MTGWRTHLAAIRAKQAAVESADSVESPSADPIGANGTNGRGVDAAKPAATDPNGSASGEAIGAFGAFGIGVEAANAAGAGAAEADPADAGEAEAVRAFYSALPAARPYQPGDADTFRDGLLGGALARPPAWAAQDSPPPRGGVVFGLRPAHAGRRALVDPDPAAQGRHRARAGLALLGMPSAAAGGRRAGADDLTGFRPAEGAHGARRNAPSVESR